METTYFITPNAAKNWLDWLATFAPVFVSLVAIGITIWVALRQTRLQAWIATQQNDLQRRQLMKDLFDRRFAIYTEVRDYLNFVAQVDGKDVIHGEPYQRFLEAIEKAEMLFDADVVEYLKDINTTVGRLYVHKAQEERIFATGDEKRIQEGTDLRAHLYDDLLKQRNAVFRPYMSLGTSR